ncbi:SAM dependent carboxyl methyltransferase [Corchorus olitorius]|uniref:SAM dependent carboxyl methyltransferase n=1 Tax=Corchorus olitorius TaxID=93759 RepID=A0A1R3HSF5_9ROSI|nr:SAM dependent carboxyl methyltransferase [Corchorus olitorius]
MVRIIERNGCFIVEKVQELSKSLELTKCMDIQSLVVSHLRAATEGLIKEHFGLEIIDQLFNSFEKKLANSNYVTFSKENTPEINLFIVLKRKAFDR